MDDNPAGYPLSLRSLFGPGLGQLFARRAWLRRARPRGAGGASHARCTCLYLCRAGSTSHGKDHRTASTAISRRVLARCERVAL